MTKRTLLLGVGLALAGCDRIDDLVHGGGNEPMACTAIGCSDGLNVTVKPRAGVFPTGKHEVVITREGGSVITCTFDFPFSEPSAFAACSPAAGVFLTVSPEQTCTTTTNGQTASQTCLPVAGRFVERLSVPGTSAKIRITQRTMTGGTYLDKEVAPSYEDVYPNGKACGAVCKQDNADFDF